MWSDGIAADQSAQGSAASAEAVRGDELKNRRRMVPALDTSLPVCWQRSPRFYIGFPKSVASGRRLGLQEVLPVVHQLVDRLRDVGQRRVRLRLLEAGQDLRFPAPRQLLQS